MTREQFNRAQELVDKIGYLEGKLERWQNLTEILHIKFKYMDNRVKNVSEDSDVSNYIDTKMLQEQVISNILIEIDKLEKELEKL